MSKALLLLLLASQAFANDMVGLGLQGTQEPSRTRIGFSVGDDHYFDQKTDYMKLKRYGYGVFKVNVGNGIGFDTYSRGGTAVVSLEDNENGFSPFLGLDFGNIWARVDTNMESYYGWAPGLSVGPQFGIGSTRILMLAKAGGYAGNMNMRTFLPHFRWMVGGSVILNSPKFVVNIDVLQFNENYIQSASIWVGPSKMFRLGIQGENTGITQSIGLLLKSDAF